mgnify:CR=1 FL=1
MKTYYPEIEPYRKGRLQVSALHELYFEECGNANGQPVLFLHGGPGGGISERNRRYFDPLHYRIILFDQRGAGKSTPFAELEENTTWDLVADIERLRQHLQVDRWIVFGGSWGSTLALTYAIQHTDRVVALILRGIFLCRDEEIQWFYQRGASFLYPDQYAKYISVIPENERHDLLHAFHKRLTSDHESVRIEAAKTWSLWEGSTLKLIGDTETIDEFDEIAVSLARIENHYFVNRAFFESDGWLLQNAEKIKDIPGIIVHGRYDVVCPVKNAFDLHSVWQKSELHIIADAGHSGSEPGIVSALVEATDTYRSFK